MRPGPEHGDNYLARHGEVSDLAMPRNVAATPRPDIILQTPARFDFDPVSMHLEGLTAASSG
jgi:hypothetical protein